jgi:hypothetical protein
MIKIFILKDNFRCMQVEEVLTVITDIKVPSGHKVGTTAKTLVFQSNFWATECEASKIEILYQFLRNDPWL